MKDLITFALIDRVENELLDAFADTDAAMPTPTDVIADVLDRTVNDLRLAAGELATCLDVDTCTAEEVACMGIADGLAELAAEVRRNGLPAGEVEGTPSPRNLHLHSVERRPDETDAQVLARIHEAAATCELCKEVE